MHNASCLLICSPVYSPYKLSVESRVLVLKASIRLSRKLVFKASSLVWYHQMIRWSLTSRNSSRRTRRSMTQQLGCHNAECPIYPTSLPQHSTGNSVRQLDICTSANVTLHDGDKLGTYHQPCLLMQQQEKQLHLHCVRNIP